MANPRPRPERPSYSWEQTVVEIRTYDGRVVARRTAADFKRRREQIEAAAAAVGRAERAHEAAVATARSVKVGKPCPTEIVLDQSDDRCGAVVATKYLCSRPTDHDGNHIATDGDRPGAEVLAVGSP